MKMGHVSPVPQPRWCHSWPAGCGVRRGTALQIDRRPTWALLGTLLGLKLLCRLTQAVPVISNVGPHIPVSTSRMRRIHPRVKYPSSNNRVLDGFGGLRSHCPFDEAIQSLDHDSQWINEARTLRQLRCLEHRFFSSWDPHFARFGSGCVFCAPPLNAGNAEGAEAQAGNASRWSEAQF